MSDSDSQADDPVVPTARKRSRDIVNWKQNAVKRKRNSGQTYVSRSTGRNVSARVVGPACNDGCFTKITMPIVNHIHQEFWEIGDFGLQNAYIQKCVRQKDVKRRRPVQNPEAARRR